MNFKNVRERIVAVIVILSAGCASSRTEIKMPDAVATYMIVVAICEEQWFDDEECGAAYAYVTAARDIARENARNP